MLLLRRNCALEYTVAADAPIRLLYGAWSSNGATYAGYAYAALAVELTVDGEPVLGEKQSMTADLPLMCGDDFDDSWWVYYAADIEGLEQGTHEVSVAFRSTEAFADGLGNTYGPGGFGIHRFRITAIGE